MRVLIWHYLEKNSERNVYLAYNLTGRLLHEEEQGCSGAWDAGRRRPHTFFDEGASPTPPLFGLKFAQKLVHCCNWLLTETQCKIISVQQNFSDVYECTCM